MFKAPLSYLAPVGICMLLAFSALVLVEGRLPAQSHGRMLTFAAEDVKPEDSTTMKDIGAIVSAIAGPGFAVWYAFYMTTKRLPEVERGHKETVEKLTTDHKAETKELIDNFRADIKGFWETCRADSAQLRDVLRSLGAKQ